MAMIKTYPTLPIAFLDVSGPVCSFKALQALPLKKCEVAINAWQEGSGDPSPDNVRTIHGYSALNIARTGVNAWSEDWELGDINNTTGEVAPSNTYIRSKDYEIIKPSTQYCVPLSQISVFYYDANKAFISRVLTSANDQVITTPSNARFFKIKRYGTTYGNNISLNYPSTQTGYVTYTGTTATIDLDGTRYGGALNALTGEMTVDRKIENAKNKAWVLSSGNYRVYAPFSDTDNSVTEEYPTGRRPIICTIAKYYETDQNIPDGYCGWLGANSNKNISVRLGSYTTSLETWNNYINDNDVEFVYYITPITVQLTPVQIDTILDANNIFADTGDTAVQYIRIGV